MNYKIILLLLLCAGMTSCRRAVEKARERIRIEAVERAESHGLTGLDLVLRVRNDTGYKLRLEHAALDLFCGAARVAAVELREPVEVPRRTTDSYVTGWRVRVSDPFALYALLRRIRQGDLAELTVSYAVEGRGGLASVNISREKVPLSEFLNTFGLDSQDLKNYLNP